MPSMIEAWFSSSEMIASDSPSSGSNTPPLASNQAAQRVPSSAPPHAAAAVEAGRVEDRVLGAHELGDALLQRAVQVLRAADEAHGRQAVPAAVERAMRGLEDGGMRGQAEVVVGAEHQHAAAVGERH